MSGGARPLFSIVMPNFNGARYLAEAVGSVQQQTLADWELLVVDDGSTDRSREIVAGCAKADPRVRLIANGRTKGVSGARNTGIEQAAGDWIKFLDADDALERDCLSTLAEMIASHPDCRLFAVDFVKVDEAGLALGPPYLMGNGHVVREMRHHAVADGYRIAEPVAFCLGVMFPMIPSTAAVHASVVRRVGLFDERMTHSEDEDFWCRAGLDEHLFVVPRPLVRYRQHAASASAKQAPRVEGRLQLAHKLAADPAFRRYGRIVRDHRRRKLNGVVAFHRGERNFGAACRYALQSIRLSPWRLRGWKDLAASLLRRP